MKKTILALLFVLAASIAQAHTVNLLCWNNGKYSFNATQLPNGSATVKVYANSNYTNLIQSFNLNVTSGQITYEVNQPIRTVKVYVKVTWSDNFVNQNASGTNQCIITPIVFGPIAAQNVENSTVVTFQVASTDDNNQIVLNFNMPDGTVKKYPITFWDKLVYGDVWVITVNNKTGSYTIKRK